jgi:L-ascorbate metabolism protein UlaG (beta-lactamase superfamily)
VGSYGVSPSEYWGMTPAEVNRIIDSNRSKVINGIHEDDFHDMIERREKLESQGIKVL